MKAVITWGYDSTTGEKYLDNFLPIKSEDLLDYHFSGKQDKVHQLGTALSMIKVRQRVQKTHLKVFDVPDNWGRKELEIIVKYGDKLK